MLSGTAHWGEVSLLSLGLFLGASDRASAQSFVPESPVSAPTLNDPSIGQLLQSSPLSWGDFNQQQVTLYPTPTGLIQHLTIGNCEIIFEAGISKDSVPLVLKNFSDSDADWAAHPRSGDVRCWNTADGVVFTERSSTIEKPLVRTPHGVFRLSEEKNSEGNQKQVEEARKLRGELIHQFDPTLDPAQRTQFRNAFARASEQAKIDLLEAQIDRRIRQQSEFPYLLNLTDHNRKLVAGLKAGTVTQELRQSQLDSLGTIYQIEFREIIARSASADCGVFRQLLVARLLNERHQTLLRNTTPADPQRGAIIGSFKNEWHNSTNAHGIRDGIVRMNDSRELFDSMTGTLENLLSKYEEKLEITPTSTIARTNLRMAELEAALLSGGNFAANRRILTLDPESPGGASCCYEIEGGGSSTLKIASQGKLTIENWRGFRKVSDSISNPEEVLKHSVSYSPETGSVSCRAAWREGAGGMQLVEYTAVRPDGSSNYRESVDLGRCTFYDRAGNRIADLMHTTDHKGIEYRWIFSSTGAAVSTWNVEKLKQPNLTEEQYLQLLAKVLDTPERLYFYLDLCMSYTPDGVSDHWQTPSETIKRVAGGVMLGDCEDYAFLARDILRKQGINAHAIYIPGHAECVWLEKDSHGRYHGRSLGTFGFDQDGITYLKNEAGTVADGFSTSREALQALMKKYQNGGLGLPGSVTIQVDPDHVQLADLSVQLAHQIVAVPLSYFVRE